MSLLYAFKQSVLDLGRGEAKAKAKPLIVADETLDRSASGLDRRASERSVMFWLLSDRAMFLVVGSDPDDHALRIPYEAISEMSLDYDDTASFLPWYIRISISPEGPGVITSVADGTIPGQPLAEPPPVLIDGEKRLMLARGEIVPLAGFVACPKRFRTALKRRMELAGRPLSVTGEEVAERRSLIAKQKRPG
ncbi:MAG: hypothetical protein M5U23_00820 [Acidimicrobiia bacterium]|nr:hypothetical protein [Acidimicrobiia bacterium]